MSSNHTIKKVISFIKSELKNHYQQNEITSFVFLIFEHLFNYSKAQLHIFQDKEISEDIYLKITKIITDLKTFKPIQYIFGSTEFYNLPFYVSVEVLIPRPETEELVDWIITENKNRQIKILDIGTGSGCIAISLAKNLPKSKVTASDISEKALNIVHQNSKLNNIQIETIQLDILNLPNDFNDKYDIIVSNPPYITEKEKSLMHQNVLEHEPHLALFVPNESPLLFYNAITKFAKTHLNNNGKLYYEINEAFGNETITLLEQNDFKEISLRKDINNKDRMVRGII